MNRSSPSSFVCVGDCACVCEGGGEGGGGGRKRVCMDVWVWVCECGCVGVGVCVCGLFVLRRQLLACSFSSVGSNDTLSDRH